MNNISAALEALLFASGEPVSIQRISLVLKVSEDELLEAFNALSKELSEGGHGIKAVRLGDKLQLCTSPDFGAEISAILETRKPQGLSPAALETLSIVAYYQPCTQAYISKLRGVDSGYSVSSLSDKGLIAQSGRLDAPGRPLLYSTTDLFLRTMGISSLAELPPLPDLKKSDAMEKLLDEISRLQTENNNTGEVI